MGTTSLVLVLAIAGVNFGWQPAADGKAGYEYTVQVEPELVDAMHRGDSIPIESNIPPEVAPIRKVRVVVGRGDLPRSAVRHTANFADQAGWTSERYGAATVGGTNSDRYVAPASSAAGANGVAPPPSLTDRTQAALSETGTAISDGLQAGMRSANDQLSRAGSQAMTDTKSAAQQFGQQMQATGNNMRNATEQTLDATGNQIRQAENSLGLTGTGTSTAAGTNGVSA